MKKATMLLSALFIAGSVAAKDLEVNVPVKLTDSEISSTDLCVSKIKDVKVILDELKLNLENSGETISITDTDKALSSMCTGIKMAHEDRLKKELQNKELFDQVGEDHTKKLTYFSAKDGQEKIWVFDVVLSGSIYSGNSNFTLAEAGGSAKGTFATHTLNITTLGQFKKTDDDKFTKFEARFSDSIQISHLTGLSNNWGAFWDTYYLSDENTGIDKSVDVTAGIGYNLLGDFSGAKNKLKITMALGYRSRANADGTVNNNPLLSTRIRYEKPITESISVTSSVSHLTNLKDSNDYELKGQAGFNFKIDDKSSIAVKYEKYYDNTPVAGKQKSDLIFKIEYKHKFD